LVIIPGDYRADGQNRVYVYRFDERTVKVPQVSPKNAASYDAAD